MKFAHSKYQTLIHSFKILNLKGSVHQRLISKRTSILSKKHDDVNTEDNENTYDWTKQWGIDNNIAAGEKFLKDYRLNEVQDIVTACERLCLGWPEATKWNWTGKKGHLGEVQAKSVYENVRIAQKYGKYMSKHVQESENTSVSYEDIENEANDYMIYEDSQSLQVKLNAKEGKKNIEKIKKKHREAILYFENEILKHESALIRYIKKAETSLVHEYQEIDQNNESYWMKVLEATEGKTTDETNINVQRTGAAFAPINLDHKNISNEEQANLISMNFYRGLGVKVDLPKKTSINIKSSIIPVISSLQNTEMDFYQSLGVKVDLPKKTSSSISSMIPAITSLQNTEEPATHSNLTFKEKIPAKE